MSTTTQIIRSLPESDAGLSFPSVNNTFGFTPWKIIAPSTNSEMSIIAVTYQSCSIPTADSIFHVIIEVGFGLNNTVTKLQLPYCVRSDTSAGYFMYEGRITLPEPLIVPKNTIILVRKADDRAVSNPFTNGVKLNVLSDILPIQTRETNQFQNFMNAGIGEKSFN